MGQNSFISSRNTQTISYEHPMAGHTCDGRKLTDKNWLKVRHGTKKVKEFVFLLKTA